MAVLPEERQGDAGRACTHCCWLHEQKLYHKPPQKKISTRMCLPEQANIIATALGWQFRVTRGMLLHEGMQFSI